MISSLTLDPDTPEDEWGNPTVRHGTDCRKAPHNQPGMLHEESDDRYAYKERHKLNKTPYDEPFHFLMYTFSMSTNNPAGPGCESPPTLSRTPASTCGYQRNT